ncbi:MAG: RNA-directed DNA polymerase [Bacteroidales bacterium]|nr:RNA-directed DNA polymerase [Bacteroidales bacterium]
MAFSKACRGKQNKKEVLLFRENFDENISTIRNQILSGNVSVGKYHYFTIHDPKERLICASAFDERILHHAIMNICHPYFERQLIYDTYATRIGKGQYQALDRAIQLTSKYQYLAKLDFRKYYYSINHNILKEKLRKIFKDKLLLHIFDKIIDSYSVSEGLGLPIGNLTSQYFANYYLSSLDHYIKEQLQIPYIRYMDDMLISDNNKENLKEYIKKITQYSTQNLKLTLKPPNIQPTSNGMSFLGYKLLPYRYLINGRSKRRFKIKMRKAEYKYQNNIWTEKEYINHLEPLLAFVKHGKFKIIAN